MPSWSPDGTSIYFIRTASGDGRWPAAAFCATTPEHSERDAGQGRRKRGPCPRAERQGVAQWADVAILDPRTRRVARRHDPGDGLGSSEPVSE
jgi:Tol biopolymer transport system component